MSCGVGDDTKCVSCVSLLFDFFFKAKLTRSQLSYHGFVFVVQRCDSGLPVRSSSSSSVRSPSIVLPSLRAAAAKHLGLSSPRRRRRRRRRPGVRGWEEELEIASGGGGRLANFFLHSSLPPSRTSTCLFKSWTVSDGRTLLGTVVQAFREGNDSLVV